MLNDNTAQEKANCYNLQWAQQLPTTMTRKIQQLPQNNFKISHMNQLPIQDSAEYQTHQELRQNDIVLQVKRRNFNRGK